MIATDDDVCQALYESSEERQRLWAAEHGWTREYINKVCNGQLPMTQEVASVLGYMPVPGGWRKVV